MAGNLQREIVHYTLKLACIMGQLGEMSEPKLFQEAKEIAQKMALIMNMPEALEALTPLTEEDVSVAFRTFTVSVGRLAKTCEALDHLENFPYRETIEEHVRIILRL